MKKGLDKNGIIDRLKESRDELKKYGTVRIGLFGSYLKGEQKGRSDIDFLVVLDENTFDNYFGLWAFLEKVFAKKIDLVIEKGLKPELNSVKEEAIYVEV
ncbi:MAG: nucleotidyltransferase family protein [archaeon]